MRAVLVTALLLARPAIAAEPPAPAATPRVVPLVWRDPLRQLPEGGDLVAHEAARALSPLGIELIWRQGDEPASEEEAQVILLSDDAARRPGPILGRVNPSMHGAIWIYARPLRAALGLDSWNAYYSPLEARCLFARALGRVVAHEVVHHLCPELSHAAHGLMQARLRPTDLTAGKPVFDPETMALLRRE
jgi:hypothetical protein